ncbi:hypothetical protein [Vibrio mexicanus]|uniref:hypothetical protein n=1 Tax=Vibrio mexicanus TaxID=1004326 RepID=UPI00063BF9CB|nr:hypothetical protein [Vibrio mexicanus]
MSRTSGSGVYTIIAWLLSLGALLAASWLADLISSGELFAYWNVLSGLPLRPWVLGSVLLVAYGACTFGLYRLGQGWFKPVGTLNAGIKNSCKALIVNLSTNNWVYQASSQGFKVVFEDQKNAEETQNQEETLKLINLKQNSISGDLKEVTEQISRLKSDNILASHVQWNWQPILKAISEHSAGELVYVCVVCTDERDQEGDQKGSVKHIQDVKRWLGGYKELSNVNVVCETVSTQGANIEQLYLGYCEIIERLEKNNISSKDIVLDITGGKSDMSIAGSMATLHKKARFQYMDQVSKKVNQYNLTIHRQLQ